MSTPVPTHLVTGAGSGIGQEVARLLLARGDRVIAPVREATADAVGRELPQAQVVVTDLEDPEGVAGEAASWLALADDRLASLIHVAGQVDLSPVGELELDSLHRQLAVNLVSPTVLTRASLPALRRAGGTVVFVGSTAGLTPHADWGAYAASKAGLKAIADALRAEEAPHGVRVTTISPGRTASPMQRRVHEQEGKDYDPTRWMRPDTIAAAILHILDLPPDAMIKDLVVAPAG